jgi:MFS family permease
MVVSQATMVGVMAMTPVHMKLHGHEDLSPFVVSAHIAGMFAFSPFVGRFTDRYGQLAAIRVAGIVLGTASVTAALSGDAEQLLFPSMFLIGVGWSFGLIGGSSLLTESVPAAERVSVQGSADLMMSLCGGVAGLASGFIRNAVGFHALASLSTLATLLLVVAAAAYGIRSQRPGVLSAVRRV